MPFVCSPTPSRGVPDWAVQLLLFGALFTALTFNFWLAIINVNLFPVSRTIVIFCEMFVVALCLGVAAARFQHLLHLPVLILIFVIINQFFLMVLFESFEPKFIRDLILPYCFLMTGILLFKYRFIGIFVTIHFLIFFVLIFELAATPWFEQIVNPQSYYIATRGYDESVFWNKDSELHRAATRAGGRFLLESLGFHRASSVFLEPVTFGNYLVAFSIFLLAFWRDIQPRQRVALLPMTAFMLIACDGRLATATIAVAIGLSVFRRLLIPYANVLYPALAFGVGAMLALLLAWDPTVDNFPGRVAKSVGIFRDLGERMLIGDFRHAVFDSGITYLLAISGIVGASVWWGGLTLLADQRDTRARFVLHAVAVLFAFSWSVSSTAFSIKTAALPWTLVGIAVAAAVSTSRPTRSPVPSTSSRRLGDRYRQRTMAGTAWSAVSRR